ncbi:hypothetical protein LJC68_06140 [Bacteroidales bacterium OttesenSCG-928-B11]|nr:hypothetical protein [Bacteroidales bacterium OttesenSCG-928-E04]MDL2312439.1 hypothetical protein [Bacteroidales bacterium OttesenSCG-928-B11]
MNSLTEKQADEITQMGRLGFSFREIALNFGFEMEEVARQFQLESGDIFQAWIKGNLSAQAEIRKTVLDAALSSSQPAILQMLKYFSLAEQNNLEAFDYETKTDARTEEETERGAAQGE